MSPKLRTARAMAHLCHAQLLVTLVPLKYWRGRLGLAGGAPNGERAKQLAADLEWAARRLPFATKCLPRAVALSAMLRNERVAHAVVIAVRPPELRDSSDALHAWVEVDGEKLIGDLSGPWIETLRVGA